MLRNNNTNSIYLKGKNMKNPIKGISNFLRGKKTDKKKIDIDVVEAITSVVYPVAEAQVVGHEEEQHIMAEAHIVPKIEDQEVNKNASRERSSTMKDDGMTSETSEERASPTQRRELNARERSATMGEVGKMSAAHLGISEEIREAQEANKRDRSAASREALLQAMVNQALPEMEKLSMLKKGLAASEQVCPNLDRYVGVVKAHFAYNVAENNTTLLFSAMDVLNKKLDKIEVEPPMLSKNELKESIGRELKSAGLIEGEVQIFTKAQHEALTSLPKIGNISVQVDDSGQAVINLPRRNSFNEKGSDKIGK